MKRKTRWTRKRYVNYIVSTNLKGQCRQSFALEFFVKHPSPDPDNYRSFVSIFPKFAKMRRYLEIKGHPRFALFWVAPAVHFLRHFSGSHADIYQKYKMGDIR